MTTNVLGSGADNLVIDGGVLQYNDLGGADRYTISPELATSGVAGPIVVNDTTGGIINLPVGLAIESVTFASSGVQMTIGGIVVQFVGTTSYSVNVGGNPLVSNAGNLLTLAEFAQSLGTTVPATGVGTPVNGGTVQADGTLGGNPPTGADAVLTAGTDVLTGNVFEAALVFNPGGTDRVNALQDEDVLTGTGDNPTLNATLGNANDGGGTSLTPTFNGLEVFNLAFTGNNSGGPQGNAAVNRVDFQDATPVIEAVNITRITDSSNFVQADNLTNVPANLSLASTNSSTAVVGFNFLNGVATGGADSTTLTLSTVNAAGISVEQTANTGGAVVGAFGLTDGVESMELVSSGVANRVGVLSAEDLQTLTISGNSALSLGGSNVINRTAGVNQIEAFSYTGGLTNVAGSLNSIDASALGASLNINLAGEVTSLTDGSSGNRVNFNLIGTAQDDVVRLLAGTDTNGDNINGGDGADVLQVFASVANGTFTALETLDIRGQLSGGPVNAQGYRELSVDASRFTGLEQLMIRNEGADGLIPGTSVNQPLQTNLTNLNATQFAGIRLQHSNTGNNALTDNLIVASLATDGSNDTVAVSYADQLDGENRGINQDIRFNFELRAGQAENVTINDNDSESNTVDLGTGAGTFGTPQNTDVQAHTGTIDLNGGQAGQFLNLDATANAYRYDQTSTGLSAEDGGTVLSNTEGDRSDIGAGAAERFIATTIDATGLASNLVVRVSDSNAALGGQTILGGTGNDTFIFDQIAGGAVNRRTAGLTISDTVNGGDGTDILGIDGDGVNVSIGASEWTNVSNIEILRPIGNNSQEAFGNGRGQTNAYNLTLTNDLLANNGTADGSIKRITIVNDNDGSNDIVSPATSTAGADDSGANNALFGLTGVEAGITVDARTLNANNSFVYNGEEGASSTADRFIFADANINGTAIIDGGRLYGGPANVAGRQTTTNRANDDVIEVRNGAEVTLGDLVGIRNVGAFEFTSDELSVQSSILSLDNETVDRLVNDGRNANSANVETLNVSAFNNPLLANAVTHLTVDSSTVTTDAFGLNFNTQGGNDLVLIDAAASGPAVVANLGANTGIATDVNGGVDTVELRNGVNGETYAINGAGNLTITSANGQVVREVILSGVERVDISNLNNLNAAQKAALVAANPIFFDGSGGGVQPPPPPPGFTAVDLPEGAGALQTVNGANGTAEDFQLGVVAARGLAPDTQINLVDFLAAEDQLTVDLTGATGLTTLDQLNGVEGIAVQNDPFNAGGPSTLVNFGPDADGNVIVLTLVGVNDATTVNVNVI